MQTHFMAMGSDYANSPTVFLPRPHAHPFDTFLHAQSFQSPCSQWAPADPSSVVHPSILPSSRPLPTSKRSRKRSRDTFDEDDIANNPVSSNDLASMEVVQEPILGPGMTLVDSTTGRSTTAESQTGTWFEEKLDKERLTNPQTSDEPANIDDKATRRPSKSVRLDSPALLAESDAANTPPFIEAPAPAIDAATLMLGIGWKVIPEDNADMQGAARGWARYIENHYALGEVKTVLKSEGQEAFVVHAREPQEGWWLFKEDLSEGRLVASTWESCVAGLRAVPTAFEGAETVCAMRTPSPTFDEPVVPELDVQRSSVLVGMEID